ncbi:response regulator (plasmid) [Pseudomonas sp. HR96]|uniref:response regulator n=1 Tax=Pseudomonas sp. HR96 TaxID=1027966 RepID=UPI002A7624F2|nr:response regulator [Pseudomonas sp. HR96]WPP02451.1 response regulator [Pseudomonas sp. HR96]
MSSIIVVEDEQTILMLMTDILEMKGHEVRAFGEADSAWNHIQMHGFNADLLITDLKMPGKIDGVELVNRLHQVLPEIPILVVSGYHVAADTCMHDDHVHFLRKPFSLDQLNAICDTLTHH